MYPSLRKKLDPLPSDVERCIFESAALSHPDCIPALLLVAHRVNRWTEHVQHQILTALTNPKSALGPNFVYRHSLRSLHTFIDSRPRLFFHAHVRHVKLVGIPTSEVVNTLSICDETVDLALWDIDGSEANTTTLLAVIRSLPLQRLSISFRRGLEDFSDPLFARITHLDLPGLHNELWNEWMPLTLLPRLTHLSFSEVFSSTSIFKNLLERCPTLRALVVLFSASALLHLLAGILRAAVPDPRFVVLLVLDRDLDWETGARGGDDYWITAEALVVQQRRSRDSGKLHVKHNDIARADQFSVNREQELIGSPTPGCPIA